MWVATRPPPGTWPRPSTIMSSPTISIFTPLTRSIAAVAASRSDSFTRSSCRPRMIVVPSAKLAATASTRYSSIIDGARSGGTSTPRSCEARTRNSAIGSPASPRLSQFVDLRAHLAQGRDQAGAQRIGHHVGQHDLRIRHDQRRDHRERGRRRIGGHHDRRALQLRLAFQRNLAAMRAVRLRRRPRRRNAAASARCGRGSTPSRSPSSCRARPAPRAAPPT